MLKHITKHRVLVGIISNTTDTRRSEIILPVDEKGKSIFRTKSMYIFTGPKSSNAIPSKANPLDTYEDIFIRRKLMFDTSMKPVAKKSLINVANTDNIIVHPCNGDKVRWMIVRDVPLMTYVDEVEYLNNAAGGDICELVNEFMRLKRIARRLKTYLKQVTKANSDTCIIAGYSNDVASYANACRMIARVREQIYKMSDGKTIMKHIIDMKNRGYMK